MRKRDEADRVRAVEVLTEMFDGVPRATAEAARKWSSPLTRARAAWSLGRKYVPEDQAALLSLAGDKNPLVRLKALEALADHVRPS